MWRRHYRHQILRILQLLVFLEVTFKLKKILKAFIVKQHLELLRLRLNLRLKQRLEALRIWLRIILELLGNHDAVWQVFDNIALVIHDLLKLLLGHEQHFGLVDDDETNRVDCHQL